MGHGASVELRERLLLTSLLLGAGHCTSTEGVLEYMKHLRAQRWSTEWSQKTANGREESIPLPTTLLQTLREVPLGFCPLFHIGRGWTHRVRKAG